MDLTPRVHAGIEKTIPGPDRALASALLSSANFDEDVCIAIVRLARGDTARIRDLIDAAKRDYRDVIAWASRPTRTYIVGFLRKGPNWTPRSFLSLKHLSAWKEAGKIVIGGHFSEDDDPIGLYIFTVASVEEAQTLTAGDPEVHAGILVFEFHRWLGADRLQVSLPPGWDI